MSTPRAWRSIVLGAALAACGGEGGGTAGGDAAGEVAALDYEVTPERYQRWVAAQQALDAIPDMPAPPKLDPMRLDESEIRRAVQYLEGDARARAALARAGTTARDYVLTTIALDQALVTASMRPAPSRRATSTAGRAATRSAAPSAAPSTVPSAPGRPQLTGTPQRNVELVRRNRDDVVRVLRTMRFRISETTADDLVDTAITRSDSVMVGKDVTVKWDVTVRRKRDSTRARKPAPPDSARPDSTDHS